MATRPKVPTKPVAGAFRPFDPYASGDALPLPEVIEKNSDSVWALWSDAVRDTTDKDADTQPATLLMGLPEMPKDPDA